MEAWAWSHAEDEEHRTSVADWLELPNVQEVLHYNYYAACCDHHQVRDHIPGLFWLVPKAWEVQGVTLGVILASKPETDHACPLEVRDCLRIYLDGLSQSCDWKGDGGGTGVDLHQVSTWGEVARRGCPREPMVHG